MRVFNSVEVSGREREREMSNRETGRRGMELGHRARRGEKAKETTAGNVDIGGIGYLLLLFLTRPWIAGKCKRYGTSWREQPQRRAADWTDVARKVKSAEIRTREVSHRGMNGAQHPARTKRYLAKHETK